MAFVGRKIYDKTYVITVGVQTVNGIISVHSLSLKNTNVYTAEVRLAWRAYGIALRRFSSRSQVSLNMTGADFHLGLRDVSR